MKLKGEELGKLIDLNTTMIKVCGLTEVREAEYLNRFKIDFAGFVLFFPKSKRNISIEKAEEIMKHLDKNIKNSGCCITCKRTDN